MLDQQIIKSRQIVADYKKHNKNTIEVVDKQINSKTWVFKRLQTDENAYNFRAKQKKALEVEKRVKQLKKVAIKTAPKKINKPYVRKPNCTYFKVVKMFKEGLSNKEISEELNLTVGGVQNHVRSYHVENNIKIVLKRGKSKKVVDRRNEMYKDYRKGMGFKEMSVKYGISKAVCSKDIQSKLAEFGEQKRDFKSSHRAVCYKLFAQLKTNAFIYDNYGIARSTVSWHRRNYNESKN